MKILPILLSLIFSNLVSAAPGVIVLAGGGPEGDIGVTTDWSHPLYKKLIENGDTTGDKKIKVVVLSLEKPDTNFIADYLKSMGADSAINIVVDSKKAANNPKVVNTLSDADIVFIRGGNQGKAYQLWKDTKLHKQIKALADRGGAIGGTSSGAMGLSEYSSTGGLDYSSDEILANPHSALLNDEIHPKTSGIHNDFFNIAEGVIVDTHCGERGRLGRLVGVHAKAVADYKNKNIVSICLEEKTGIAITNGKAEVFGTGTAHFLQETADTEMIRKPNHPLSYSEIRDDALTEGWRFDLKSRLPDTSNLPKTALAIENKPNCFGQLKNNFQITNEKKDEVRFIDISKSDSIFVLADANSSEKVKSGDKRKGFVQTNALKKLYDNPNASIILLDGGSKLLGTELNTISSFKSDKKSKEPEVPSLILDCKYCSYKSLSSFVSTQDDGSNTLHSPALIDMRIHIINSESSYNTKSHIASVKKEIIENIKCNNLPSEEVAPIQSLNFESNKIIDRLECN